MADHISAGPRSPLAGIAIPALPALRIAERPLVGLVAIAAWPDTVDALAAALSREGLPPIPALRASTTRDDAIAIDAGPGRMLVEAARPDLFAALDSVIPAEIATVTDLGAARIALRIEGARARWVLSKGVAIDLHPDAFPVGMAVTTEIAHVGVILRRADESAYDLYPYRGFARALLDWLIVAGGEDGRPITGTAPAPRENTAAP
ncbi:hypothetical protein L1787_02125 [Acuticoccus sp. M5D2P5]|uniref:sarcosine oxidase subunit gamma n=1 Tax=Acuticoccus kalidii TaxID=2910977 RepID=UPI001F20D766|nr:sarcosine oxidase subunit gamma family protein [Acuticoccus kalidii]MCF3932211.1 hypothetical protein [Acuticoccus kalidii]